MRDEHSRVARGAHLASLAALATLAACGGGTPPPWRVTAGFLRDASGRAVILRGVNLSGRQKTTPYLDFQTAGDYRRVRDDWGMNAIRFIMPWAAVEPEEGRYDDAYLDAVAERLGWARDAGLLVVLDMHQDLFGEGFAGGDGAPRWACDAARYAAFVPRTPWFLGYLDENVVACFDRLWNDPTLGERFADAWAHVATKLADQPAVIGFDIINEPHWGSASVFVFEPDLLGPFYARVIEAVRARAPDWIPFVEPSSARTAGLLSATRLDPFAGDVVYAPHAYDAQAESGDGFDPARAPALAANIAALASEARGLQAAFVLGEYGGVAALPGIGAYMDTVYDAAGAAAAGGFYWHYGRDDGYGILDANGNEKPALMAALVRPFPERVAGDPISYDYDDTSGRFTLRYHPDPSIAAPTVIVLPARRFPAGARVVCDGCAADVGGGVAHITTAPRGDPAVVTVERL